MKQDSGLTAAAKNHFLHMAQRSLFPIAYIFPHMENVEKWAQRILKSHPEADRTITLTGMWLHDIGQTFGNRDIDHAVKSEHEARRFLKKKRISPAAIEQITHCVRAHRCRDVQPATIEAKIVAAADSASHFTDSVYLDIVILLSIKEAQAKLARDYRDVGLLPGLRKEIKPLYKGWKQILKGFPNWCNKK